MAKGRKPVGKRLADAGHTPRPAGAVVAMGDAITEPPRSLHENAVALATWRRAVSFLCSQGNFAEPDRAVVERYAQAASLNAEAAAKLNHGQWYQESSKTGWGTISPAFSMFEKTNRACIACERLLGIAPDGRRMMRFDSAGEGGQDELLSFLGEYDND